VFDVVELTSSSPAPPVAIAIMSRFELTTLGLLPAAFVRRALVLRVLGLWSASSSEILLRRERMSGSSGEQIVGSDTMHYMIATDKQIDQKVTNSP
jgi:hypothetical protein